MPEGERKEGGSPIQSVFKWGGSLSATAILTLLGNHFFDRLGALEQANGDLQLEIQRLQAAQAQWGTMAEHAERLRKVENELEVTQRVFAFIYGREIPKSRLFPPSAFEAPGSVLPETDDPLPPEPALPAERPAARDPQVDPDQFRQMQQRKYAPKE